MPAVKPVDLGPSALVASSDRNHKLAPMRRSSSALALEALCDLGDATTLRAHDAKLVVRRGPRSVRARQRARAVGRATGNLLHIRELRLGVWHTYNDHTVMQERPVDADNRGLLSAMLGPGAGENTADFAGQCTLDPQTAGLIEKVAHLRAHVSETGRRSDDDCIRTRQAVDAGDRYMRERRPGFRRSRPF